MIYRKSSEEPFLMPKLDYKKAGVNIDRADDFIRRIKPLVNQTTRPEVIGGLGGFSGLFVPLSFTPGTQYVLPAGNYFPNLIEFGVGLGIIGYGLALLTLGVKYLPLFSNKNHT